MNLQKVEQDLEKADKELRHEPVKLWCLGCGRLISDKFTGGMWSYTCCCTNEFDSFEERSMCRAFATEKGLMLNSSLILNNMSFKACKECKTEEEHVRRTLESYLGKRYKEFKIKDKEVLKLREEFINLIINKIKSDAIIPLHELYNKAGLLEAQR